MKKIYLLGCSFTENLNGLYLNARNYFKENYNYENLGFQSRSNFQILEDINKLDENTIAIIQWSCLTRPDNIGDYSKNYDEDLNKKLEKVENPLSFLIDNFINVVSIANTILEKKNIHTFQYIGWAQWLDSEITDVQRSKLKKLPIKWFYSKQQPDMVFGSCWQYKDFDGLFEINNKECMWPEIVWGGMSEWIRENVEINKRFISPEDAHPSAYAGDLFYQKVVIPEINKLISLK